MKSLLSGKQFVKLSLEATSCVKIYFSVILLYLFIAFLPSLIEVCLSQVLNFGSSLSTLDTILLFSPIVDPPTTNIERSELARPKLSRRSVSGDRQSHLLVSGWKQ